MKKESSASKTAVWINILAAATLAFSLLMACVTPFVALSALTAITLKKTDAYATVILTFFINQLVGFAFLNYPLDAMTLAWGGALGLSALAALVAARAAAAYNSSSPLTQAPASLAAAFVGQQGVIYAASWFLPSGPEAFALTTLLGVAAINGLAFTFLSCLQVICARIGLSHPLTFRFSD